MNDWLVHGKLKARGEAMTKQHFEFDRLKVYILALLVVLVLLAALLVLGRKDRYQNYKKVALTNKQAGEVVLNEFHEGQSITAIHYPSFEDEKLNQLIQVTVDSIKAYQGDEQDLIFLDYESMKSFDQYVTIHFFEKVYDAKFKLKQERNHFITYDMKAKKELVIEDLFRSDYLSQLKSMFQVIPQYFQIEAEGIRCFDENGKELGLFEYANHERFIALKNPSVPSLAPKESIKVNKMDIDPNKPMIVFTFDDGPTPEITKRIMDAFLSVQGRATFFELGNRMESYGDITKLLHENGFEIGNHSYSHANLSIADEATIRQEIYATQDLAYSLTGEEIKLVRPTYGAISELMQEVIPFRLINWNIDSLDWKTRNKEAILNEVLPYIKDGSIILMHDLYESTAQAVETLLPILDEKGYQFVTLSDYLASSKGNE